MTPEDAAALLHPVDTIGMGLGPCHPQAFLEALGTRNDWENLRINGAFLGAFTDLFNHPNVHFLSLFWGPLERLLQASGANIGFAPADYRRFAPIIERARPRVMTTIATPPDAEGNCSLSLHGGHTIRELQRAAADPDRLLIVELDDAYPRHLRPPAAVPARDPRRRDRRGRALVGPAGPPARGASPGGGGGDRRAHQRADPGRRDDPDRLRRRSPRRSSSVLAEGDGGDYGIHSEMFTTGLMDLHQAGKVTNQKGQFDGVSVTTFAGGSPELYEWLDGNTRRRVPARSTSSTHR